MTAPLRLEPRPDPAERPVDGASRRGFAAPTPLDGLHVLARVVGPDTALALWASSARATGVHGTDLELDQHVRLVEHLAGAAAGPARVAVVSHLTRLRAHRVLSRADV